MSLYSLFNPTDFRGFNAFQPKQRQCFSEIIYIDKTSLFISSEKMFANFHWF